jgi:hypothetical protein
VRSARAKADRLEVLACRIEAARRRTIGWLDTMQAPGAVPGVSRISAVHDVAHWPGVLLPGTYNAVLCRALIGDLDRFDAAARQRLIAWFESFRRPDGSFRIAGMTEDAIFKKPDPIETRRYIDFHLANYTLGAIEMLDASHPPRLDFALPFLDRRELLAWLACRDLRDPWQEGNNIVNLASFLLLLERFESARHASAVRRAFDALIEWQERLQEPTTGFWGVGQGSDPMRLLHAFAGSMHGFHLWYVRDRVLPFHARAVDYCLTLPPGVDSACIDVDATDVLVHGHRLLGHRGAEIEVWCRSLLEALLDFQNEDGGFCDVREGVRRQDGWVRGYQEPQGLSNSFATWFRWIAIAMIADLLWPARWPWRFRRMIGIGYRKDPR